MATKKKHSRKAQKLAERKVTARRSVPRPRAMANVPIPIGVEPSTPAIRNVLGSFAEQTGANFG